jgi:hypothetical protein
VICRAAGLEKKHLIKHTLYWYKYAKPGKQYIYKMDQIAKAICKKKIQLETSNAVLTTVLSY